MMSFPPHRFRSTVAAVAALAVALGGVACKDKVGAPSAGAAASAVAIGISECAACGMVVREQPAPRGQVVHRDGTRVFLCSIADLVQYLQAPSKHGSPVAIFVEALEPDALPKDIGVSERPWVRSDAASFVVGVERQGIMGKPVLAYANTAAADAAVKRHGGVRKSWTELERWVLTP